MVKRTQQQLRADLEEQTYFLEASCRSFDSGRAEEAKRLAVAIRVLVHDTVRSRNSSRSLLGQLGVKDRWGFLDTAGPIDPRNLLPTMNLLAAQVSGGGDGRMESRYVPRWVLGRGALSSSRALRFEDWWSAPVVKDGVGEVFTRADLVLVLANKEGGAHVDEATPARFAALARSNTLGWSVSTGSTESNFENDPILPCVRQIAFEIVQTLRARRPAPVPDAE